MYVPSGRFHICEVTVKTNCRAVPWHRREKSVPGVRCEAVQQGLAGPGDLNSIARPHEKGDYGLPASSCQGRLCLHLCEKKASVV